MEAVAACVPIACEVLAAMDSPRPYAAITLTPVLVHYCGMSSRFLVVMRGYDMRQIDEAAELTDAALNSTGKEERDAALTRLRSSRFRVKVRGYSRPQVDNYIEHRILELSRPN